MAAISAYHAPLGGLSVVTDPLLLLWCSQAETCVVAILLEGLSDAPFEPLDVVALKFHTLKTPLLLAITSLKRVGDLQVLPVPRICSCDG